MRWFEMTSISRKFLLPTLALTVLLLGGLGVFLAFCNNAAIRTMMDSKGNSVADFMNKISLYSYSNFDYATLEDFVKEATLDPEVAFAVYYDDKDNPLTRSSVEPADASSLIVYQRTIQTEAGQRLGSLKIGYSKKKLAENLRKNVLIVTLGIALAIALFSGGITFLVKRIIIRRMKQTVEMITAVAQGNLGGGRAGMSDIHEQDEIAELGRATHMMADNLKEMIGNLQKAAARFGATSGEMKETSEHIMEGSRVQAESVEEAASSVEEMHASLKEIAGSVGDLLTTSENTSSSVIEMASSIGEVDQTMNELASSIGATSSAIAQMSSAVRQIAESIESLSTATAETAASATEINASVREVETSAMESASLAEAVVVDAQQIGMQSIGKNIEGMKKLEITTRRTADTVKQLGERAEDIGGILAVIGEITEQTGLLALNAAILAAQAGEHGKGFAVVADAIRELADRTAASTKKIAVLIGSVQTESRQAVQIMEEEVSMVEEGVRLAGETADALQKIVERASQSRDMSRNISHAAAEQARAIHLVSDRVEKISGMTAEIAQATNEQKSGSVQIMQATRKMQDLTQIVNKSTREQAQGSKDISHAVENITSKISMVMRSADEVQSGSELIVKSIVRIREIAGSNADLAEGLNDFTNMLAGQSEVLSSEVRRFKMDQQDGSIVMK